MMRSHLSYRKGQKIFLSNSLECHGISSFSLLGWIMGGNIGVVTFAVAFFLGPVITWEQKSCLYSYHKLKLPICIMLMVPSGVRAYASSDSGTFRPDCVNLSGACFQLEVCVHSPDAHQRHGVRLWHTLSYSLV